MQKFKLWKTVDCVFAGLYRKSSSQEVDSPLLGLYDEGSRLNYVGRARVLVERPRSGACWSGWSEAAASPAVH